MKVIAAIIVLSAWISTLLMPLLFLSHGHPPKGLESDKEDDKGTHFMRG